MADPLVTGTLRAAGVAAAGAEVQLFAHEPEAVPRLRLLAGGVTDPSGAFALEPAADDVPARGILVAKLKDDPVGVLTSEVELPAAAAVDLAADGPFYSIAGTVESDAGLPAELTLVADPVRPDGVPDDVVPFLSQSAPGVFDGRYAAHTVTPPSFQVRLQRGRWRLRAEYVNYDRPNIHEPDFRNYATAEVRTEPDGASAPGTPSRGFELDVDGDRRVTLVLRELLDDEL